MFTFDGDVKCLACSWRKAVLRVTFEDVVRVASYVDEYQLVTDADHSTLFIVAYHHIVIAIIIDIIIVCPMLCIDRV